MELKDLVPIVIVFIAVGILIGISITVTSKIGNAARVEMGVVNDSFYLVNNSVNNLDHGNVTTFRNIINASSVELEKGNYTVQEVNGTITFNTLGSGNSTCAGGRICYANYDYYDYDTQTATAMSSVTAELAGISSNWMSILVVCVIAAIVLGLVTSSFTQRR